MIAPGRYAIGVLGLVSLCCTIPSSAPIVVTTKVGDPVEISCGPKHAELAAVERITTRMSLDEITDVLGPPGHDSGSAQVVLAWDCTEGRRFYVSMNQPEPSSKPVELGFTR